MSIESVLAEREETHGDFVEVSRVYSGIKEALYDGVHNNADARFEAALDMIAMKMARIVCGNPYHKDSWDDIAGYATLISKELERLSTKDGEAGEDYNMGIVELIAQCNEKIKDRIWQVDEKTEK